MAASGGSSASVATPRSRSRYPAVQTNAANTIHSARCHSWKWMLPIARKSSDSESGWSIG
jgi:hypothetical protein